MTIEQLTNVASAVLLQPKIADNIVIVWSGGHALHWPSTGAPFVLLPCMGVVSAFTVTA